MLTDDEKTFIRNCKDRISYYKPFRVADNVIGIVIIAFILTILTIIGLSL